MNDALIAVASATLYLSALSLKAWWIYRNSLREAKVPGEQETAAPDSGARHQPTPS